MEEKERQFIEAVKLSLGGIERKGLSAKGVLVESIEYLCDLYEKTREQVYLIRAFLHMKVYLELGFSYEEEKDLFEPIIQEIKQKKDIEISKEVQKYQRIFVNKSRVRNLLCRWNPSSHSMPIAKVVEDIIIKVQKQQEGCYNYWTEYKFGKEKRRFEYYLYIYERQSLFYDAQKNYYYQLEWDEEKK